MRRQSTLVGCPGALGRGAKTHVFLEEDDIPRCPDLFLEAGYLHKVRGVG